MTISWKDPSQPAPDERTAESRNQAAEPSPALDLEQIRTGLAQTRGKDMWRSLEELAGDPGFQELVENEFPRQAAAWPDGVSRRRFLQLSSASLALGGLTACTRQPIEKIVPYVNQPEQMVPGRPLYFATATSQGGYATGVLAESHMGRPTKLEGSPEHPAGTGATDLFTQATVLTLYDPDRSQVVRHNGRIRSWDAFASEFKAAVTARQALGAERMRILTGTVTSPMLADRIAKLQEMLPEAKWHQYEPVNRDSARKGALTAFARPVETHYDLSEADVVVSLDSDFLTNGPGHLQYARDFAARRKIHGEHADLNRLYAVESMPTATGTLADHRIPVRASQLPQIALALAAEVGVAGISAPSGLDAGLATAVTNMALDLAATGPSAVVIPGDYSSADVHALVHAINEALGAIGTTVKLTEPVEAEPIDQTASIAELAEAMLAGEVDSLLCLDVNPVFDAPAELDFKQAMYKVGRRVHVGLYFDETGEMCHWHIPMAHALECWGDARAYEGTVTLCQPLIEPLYGGRSIAEVLAALVEEEETPSDEMLKGFWQARLAGGAVAAEGDGAFDLEWRRYLHDGFIPDTAAAPVEATVGAAGLANVKARLMGSPGAGIEVAFRPDPTLWDGSWANNGWLQECPKPLTKLTWDNAAIIGPAMAQSLGVANGRMVRITAGDQSLEIPVYILPGHPDGMATVHLGYGRRRAGRVGDGAGFDAYALRTSQTQWLVSGVAMTPLEGTHELASTQLHANIELEGRQAGKRHLVRATTAEDFHHHPDFAQHMGPHVPDVALFPDWEYNGHAWGLTVDLNACTACNACVVACQSENNIPVVGKDQVLAGREMHWIRIDRYYEGDLDEPEVHHQPVMCQHCENAPCEVVCPVSATVHSEEGLNDMVYNRCVGTRYCSNNCPYKVRRFNFLKYNDRETPVLDLLRNPDVTLRFRGVMEKCTFCVQRINGARQDAKVERRDMRDGDVHTACQQVCPTGAIVFGDINDEEAQVTARKAEPRNYTILDDIRTRPRTSYLAKVSNPNPKLEKA